MRDPPSSSALNRHMSVDPPSATQLCWSPLVPQSAVRVCTCPPWATQYAAASDAPAEATPDGDPAKVVPGVAKDEAAAELAAAAELDIDDSDDSDDADDTDDAGDSDPDPEPQPASTATSPHANAARPY